MVRELVNLIEILEEQLGAVTEVDDSEQGLVFDSYVHRVTKIGSISDSD